MATSDGLEQIIILGQGAKRLSASGLQEEIAQAKKEMTGEWKEKQSAGRNLLIDNLPGEMQEYLRRVRLGKEEL